MRKRTGKIRNPIWGTRNFKTGDGTVTRVRAREPDSTDFRDRPITGEVAEKKGKRKKWGMKRARSGSTVINEGSLLELIMNLHEKTKTRNALFARTTLIALKGEGRGRRVRKEEGKAHSSA